MKHSLEVLLRAAAASGQLSHVSVVARTTRHGVMFAASYRDTKRDGARHAEHVDPAAALAEVLSDTPTRSKKSGH